MQDFKVGDRVRCDKYGEGTIIKFACEDPPMLVRFDEACAGLHDGAGDYLNDRRYFFFHRDGTYCNRHLTLIEEGERKLKTWEVLKLAYEGKHEGQALKCFGGTYWIKGKHISYDEESCCPVEHNLADVNWELVPQTVTFTEAVEAAIAGKSPVIVLCLFHRHVRRHVDGVVLLDCISELKQKKYLPK
jgi:hypothetical protein